MQMIMEIYDLSKDIEAQLNERRAGLDIVAKVQQETKKRRGE